MRVPARPARRRRSPGSASARPRRRPFPFAATSERPRVRAEAGLLEGRRRSRSFATSSGRRGAARPAGRRAGSALTTRRLSGENATLWRETSRWARCRRTSRTGRSRASSSRWASAAVPRGVRPARAWTRQTARPAPRSRRGSRPRAPRPASRQGVRRRRSSAASSRGVEVACAPVEDGGCEHVMVDLVGPAPTGRRMRISPAARRRENRLDRLRPEALRSRRGRRRGGAIFVPEGVTR